MTAKGTRNRPEFEEGLSLLLAGIGPAARPPADVPSGASTDDVPSAAALRPGVCGRASAFRASVRRNWLPWLVFLSILLALVWRIGSYPAYFNDTVEHMIHVQVDKVFDGIDDSKTVGWYWTRMYTHEAYSSPVYSAFIEAGLRLFGLTLFGVRIFLVLFAFLALVLAWFALKRHLPERLVLVFLLLLALSPWHLVIARSGGIFALSVAMYLGSLSLLLLLAGRGKSVPAAALAGLAVALLPYGYSALRLLPPLLLLLVFVAGDRFERTNYRVLVVTLVLVAAIQLGNYPDTFKFYLDARGEGLNTVAKMPDGSYDYGFIVRRLTENAATIARLLMGQNVPARFLDVNIAETAYRGDVVLYPKFLVPFLPLGIGFALSHLAIRRKVLPALAVGFLLVGLVPGLMVGIGSPNMSRSLPVLVPLYLLIAYGLYHTCAVLHGLFAARAPRLLPALLVVAVLFTSLYQVNNYFGYPKDPGAGNMIQKHVYEDVIREYLRADPDGRVLYHEAAPFNVYSYVVIRWLGQEDLRAMLEDGRLTFLRSDNLEWVRREIKAGTYDLIVSTEPKRLEALIPEVVPLLRYTEERFQAYGTVDAAARLPFQPDPADGTTDRP